MFRISRFGELLKLLPRGMFDRQVEQSQADKHCKSFTTWRHLVSMLYLQVSGQRSLRTMESGYNAQQAHHYHLGCGEIHRSTLSEANEKTARAEVFEELARVLMSQASRQLRAEGEQMLQLLDSTSITLKGRKYDEWVKHTRNKNCRGIKVHVLFAAKERVPLSAQTSAATLNDVEYGREMELESGVVYVFDKGYCDYGWWWKIETVGSHFVTRFKSNARLEVVERRKIAKDAREIILKDEWVRFTNQNPGGGRRNVYAKPLRRIEVSRKEQNKPPLVLATNELGAEDRRALQAALAD